MYEAFYGMTERPFSLTPDPSFLFMSRKHKFAFNMLEYSLTGQAGFTVITGAIGSGKTTLIRHLLKRSDSGINYGVISNTHESFGSLLQWILTAFRITATAEEQADRYQAFLRYLTSQAREGRRTILIVDEAQNLSIESLEELRLLSNVNGDKDQLLQMILVGQPELLPKLRRPELLQFAQRISVNYHLSALNLAETEGYIAHRLEVAGAKPGLFDQQAVWAIFHFTNGVPRMINSICDMALVYGYAEEQPRIGIDTVLSVIDDKHEGALMPICNLDPTLNRGATILAINAAAASARAADRSLERTSRAQHVAESQPQCEAEVALSINDNVSTPAHRGHAAFEARPIRRLAPANTIQPIISHPPQRPARHAKMKWLLRLL